jgi:hypothetical protein
VSTPPAITPAPTSADAFSATMGRARGRPDADERSDAVERLLVRARGLTADQLDNLPYTADKLVAPRDRAWSHLQTLGRVRVMLSAFICIKQTSGGRGGAEQTLSDAVLALLVCERLGGRDIARLTAAARTTVGLPELSGLMRS